MHEAPQVLQGDIKPSNLIWREDQPMYLIDFGAAKEQEFLEVNTFTIVKTYSYTPIEQFVDKVVESSNLYALGANLIYLLTGIERADLPKKTCNFFNPSSIPVRL